VIKTADRIIDLGPEGGEEGGALVAQGTPEQVAAKADSSYTGRFLADIVKPAARRRRRGARAKVPAAA
jgi:excinuclease ABC subunit A